MLFDHLHQFLSALIQRADAGYIAILSDSDKAQLRVITGLCTVSLGHCDLRGADDAFGIHWPHTAFSPALQDVVACKIYLIWSRRGFNESTFRLYCTSFPHLLQLSICSIEPLLFQGYIAGPACLTPPKSMYTYPGAVHSAAGGPSEACRACLSFTVLAVVSAPAASSARYRRFHLRTARSQARCIWLIS